MSRVLLSIGFICPAIVICAQGPPPDAKAGRKVIRIDTSTLEGVVDATSAGPLDRATVVLQNIDGGGQNAKTVTTDLSGHWVIEDVMPGRFRLWAQRNGYVRCEYGVRGPGRPGRLIEFEGGENLRDISFSLTPEAVVSGRVVTADYAPVTNAIVQIARQRYSSGRRQFVPIATTISNNQGEYRLAGLAPGSYYLYAVPPVPLAGAQDRLQPGYLPAFYPEAGDVSAAAPLSLTAAMDLRHIDIELKTAELVQIRGRIRNTVTGDSGEGAVLTIAPEALKNCCQLARRSIIITGDDGRFEAPAVAPGSYVIMADWFDGDVRYCAAETVVVRPGHNLETDIEMSLAVQINGRVRVEGSPEQPGLDRMRIQLDNPVSNTMPRIAAQVRSDGTFTCANVAPGLIYLSVQGVPDTMYVKSVKLGNQELNSSWVMVPAGAAAPLEVVLSPAAAGIAGIVEGPDKKPRANAYVVLIPEQKRREQVYLYREVTTDAEGSFRLSGLAPGRYQVLALDDLYDKGYFDAAFVRYERVSESVNLVENDRQNVRLSLATPRQ